MNSRRLIVLAVRTAVFLVVAVIAVAMTGWTSIGIGAIALLGLATAVQLGGALWMRRQERSASGSSGTG